MAAATRCGCQRAPNFSSPSPFVRKRQKRSKQDREVRKNLHALKERVAALFRFVQARFPRLVCIEILVSVVHKLR
jgi:hypothetical protein